MTRGGGQGRKTNRVVRAPAGKFGYIQKRRLQQRTAPADQLRIQTKSAKKPHGGGGR